MCNILFKWKWILKKLQLVLNAGNHIPVLQISAAGLYYLAELVEEYTVMSKRVIWLMTVVSK